MMAREARRCCTRQTVVVTFATDEDGAADARANETVLVGTRPTSKKHGALGDWLANKTRRMGAVARAILVGRRARSGACPELGTSTSSGSFEELSERTGREL